MPQFDDEPQMKKAAKEFMLKFHEGNPGDFPDTATSLGPSSYGLLVAVAERLADAGRPRVLDLGCGNGALCAMVSQALGGRCQVTGVDINPVQTERAQQLNGAENISFRCAPGDRLGLPENSVDLVLSHMSFCFMPPLEAVLREIDRVTADGGEFSFVVGDGERDIGIELEYQEIANRVMEEEGVTDLGQALVDPRVFDIEAFKDLVAAHTSFAAPLERQRFQLPLKMTGAEYLTFITGDYGWSLLSEAGRARITREVAHLLPDDGDAPVSAAIALQQITLTKPKPS
ncbi:MAG: class I SAM-dependent methyltransferase [Pseudomonadota bacterium]